MSIVVFQHSAEDTLGRLGPFLRDRAHRIDIRRLDLSLSQGGSLVPPDFDNVQAVISLGGPQNVGDGSPWMNAEMDFLREAHKRQLPLLGICLGHQLIAAALGGEVGPSEKPEVGFCRVQQTVPGNTDTMLAGVPWGTYQFQSHGCEVKKAPPDSVVLASSAGCKVQCFRVGLRTYGFQFHFEAERSDIDAFARDGFTQSLCEKSGISAADLKKQADEHYDTFARIGNRLCDNVATYMFPALKKLRAV